MEISSKKQKYMRIALAALLVISLLLLGSTIKQTTMAMSLLQRTENHYMSSFSDLCDYVDDIDVLIKKAMLSSGQKQVSMLASQIFMEAASAKTCLSQLPLFDINLEKTSKFLVQTGDYMMFLSSKAINGEEVTEKEFENLSALSDYAEKISDSLDKLQDKLYNGEISFVQNKNRVKATEETEVLQGFSDLENEFSEYPSLIYDGPFSEHMENQTSVFLKYQGQITEKMAFRRAQEVLGKKKAENLELSSEGGGPIKSYVLKKEEDGRSIQIAITKQGGHVLWMLDSRNVEETKIDIKDARLFAKRFLDQIGYKNMKESYYEKTSNVATINYAYSQEDVTVYTDLIKVKVALDNGEILGIEAKGYLMNHKDREIEGDILEKEEAMKRAGEHLLISDVNLAIIPLESGREVLCYELKGSFDDDNFLIYINAHTGEDEKILMLIESPEGILTL